MSYTDQIKDVLETVVEAAKETNEFAVKTGKEIFGEVMEAGEEWVKLGKKAVDGGSKLIGEQQVMTLTAFEEVKDQLTESTERFKKIVNI